MTIKKKTELIKEMEKHAWDMLTFYENMHDDEKVKLYRKEWIALHDVVTILTDNKYAKDLAKIYEMEV